MLFAVLRGLMVGRTAQGGAFVFLLGYLVTCALLYPYARFVYEGIVGFIMGQNIFILPLPLMLGAKVMTMAMCFAGAVFIAPVGLAYLYLRHSRDERAGALS